MRLDTGTGSPELTQGIGADNAEEALKAHAEAIGVDYEPNRQAVIDLLTNLRHFCDTHKLDFSQLCEISHQYYLMDKQDY